jgi:hypothetical protein
MTDQPNPNIPQYREADTAPIIYFDAVAAQGTMNGAIQIELAGRILTPIPDGTVRVGFMTAGRLRCSPAAATFLRDAINSVLQMLAQPQQEPTVAPGKLN